MANQMNSAPALQLEMAKPLYMHDTKQDYHEQRAREVQQLLIDTVTSISETLLQNITRW